MSLRVVSSQGLLVLLLHLGGRRRLKFGPGIRLALPHAPSHRPDRRACSRSFAGVAGDCSDHGPTCSASGCPTHSAALSLRSLFCRLLLRRLHLRAGRSRRRRTLRIDSGLPPDLVVAVELVPELLVLALVVFWIDEYSDLLSRRKTWGG